MAHWHMANPAASCCGAAAALCPAHPDGPTVNCGQHGRKGATVLEVRREGRRGQATFLRAQDRHRAASGSTNSEIVCSPPFLCDKGAWLTGSAQWLTTMPPPKRSRSGGPPNGHLFTTHLQFLFQHGLYPMLLRRELDQNSAGSLG
jgi:hypothetical protein